MWKLAREVAFLWASSPSSASNARTPGSEAGGSRKLGDAKTPASSCPAGYVAIQDITLPCNGGASDTTLLLEPGLKHTFARVPKGTVDFRVTVEATSNFDIYVDCLYPGCASKAGTLVVHRDKGLLKGANPVSGNFAGVAWTFSGDAVSKPFSESVSFAGPSSGGGSTNQDVELSVKNLGSQPLSATVKYRWARIGSCTSGLTLSQSGDSGKQTIPFGCTVFLQNRARFWLTAWYLWLKLTSEFKGQTQDTCRASFRAWMGCYWDQCDGRLSATQFISAWRSSFQQDAAVKSWSYAYPPQHAWQWLAGAPDKTLAMSDWCNRLIAIDKMKWQYFTTVGAAPRLADSRTRLVNTITGGSLSAGFQQAMANDGSVTPSAFAAAWPNSNSANQVHATLHGNETDFMIVDADGDGLVRSVEWNGAPAAADFLLRMAKVSAPVPVTGDAQNRHVATLFQAWATNYSSRDPVEPAVSSASFSAKSWTDFCNFPGNSPNGWASVYPREMLWYWFNGDNSSTVQPANWQVKFDCIAKRHWYSLTTHCFGDRYYDVVGWLTASYGSFQAAFTQLAVGAGPGFEGVITQDRFAPTWNGQPDGPSCPAEDAFAFFDANGDGQIRAAEWAAAGKRMAFLRQSADTHAPALSLDAAQKASDDPGLCGEGVPDDSALLNGPPAFAGSDGTSYGTSYGNDGAGAGGSQDSPDASQSSADPARPRRGSALAISLVGLLLACLLCALIPMLCCGKNPRSKFASKGKAKIMSPERAESQREIEVVHSEQEELGYSTLPLWTNWVPNPILQLPMAQNILLKEPVQYKAVPTNLPPPSVQPMQQVIKQPRQGQMRPMQMQVMNQPQHQHQHQPGQQNPIIRTISGYLQAPSQVQECVVSGQAQGQFHVPGPLDGGYVSEDEPQVRRALLEGGETEYISTSVVRAYA